MPSLPSTFDLARPVVASPSSHPVHASSSSHPVHRPQSSTASVTPYDYEYHMQELAPGEARGPWMPAMSHISGASSSVWSALVPVTTADTATTDAAIAVHVARMAATIASPNGREPSASASTRVSTESIIRRDRETLSCPPPMPPPMASSSSVDLHRSTPTSAENHGCLSLPKRRRYDVPVADDLQGGSNDEE